MVRSIEDITQNIVDAIEPLDLVDRMNLSTEDLIDGFGITTEELVEVFRIRLYEVSLSLMMFIWMMKSMDVKGGFYGF